MTDTHELEPCPICGGECRIEEDGGLYYVGCVDEGDHTYSRVARPAPSEEVEAHNRLSRAVAERDQLAERVEVLRETVQNLQLCVRLGDTVRGKARARIAELEAAQAESVWPSGLSVPVDAFWETKAGFIRLMKTDCGNWFLNDEEDDEIAGPLELPAALAAVQLSPTGRRTHGERSMTSPTTHEGRRCSDCEHLDHERQGREYIRCAQGYRDECPWRDGVRPFPELIRVAFRSAETCPHYEPAEET